jgi:transposase
MPTKTKRPALEISQEDLMFLEQTSQSRTLPKREVDRAKILLYYAANRSIKETAVKVGVCRKSVYDCIDKALAMGTRAGLKDLPHHPNNAVITSEAKVWVVNLACTKPTEHGYAAEMWSSQSLATHIRKVAHDSGHPCLARIVKSTVHSILKDHKLKPHKIKYYLEKRDPDFDSKMHEILIVYKEVEFQNNCANQQKKSIVTLSIDEKPGVQAIENTAPDLSPCPNKHQAFVRDHEYIRHGTASILAGLDLHDGHIFVQVHHRHRSHEFIMLLEEIDAYYEKDVKIRIILDNHSAHISRETRKYLATRPNRFEFIHTPKHGSWLNIVETLFGKMARTFLRGIRVTSWDDLKQRILKGVEEINQTPVVHRWTKFDSLDCMWKSKYA